MNDSVVSFVYRDDQILFNGILFYVLNMILPGTHSLPFWRSDGVVIISLVHAGPVEFLYYWFHRALHHHYLYSRYHSHHHSSIVTEPITCKILLYICVGVYERERERKKDRIEICRKI